MNVVVLWIMLVVCTLHLGWVQVYEGKVVLIDRYIQNVLFGRQCDQKKKRCAGNAETNTETLKHLTENLLT